MLGQQGVSRTELDWRKRCPLHDSHARNKGLDGMAATTALPGDLEMADSEASRLRRYNVVVGLLHLAQAIAMVALSTDFTLPVTRTIPAGPPGTLPGQEIWFNLPLGIAVSAFLFLAALDHLLMASPSVNGWYNRMLLKERNYARWIEYSVSASLMVVLIAMLTSVTDIGALMAIAGVNASMILFGLLQEAFIQPSRDRVNWMPYLFGCFAGAIPWVVIALHLGFAETSSSAGGPPTFVYGIIVSLFLLFNTFSINMVLQYRQAGPWRSYLYGERVYIIISLIAKSALAWQVFANVLVG